MTTTTTAGHNGKSLQSPIASHIAELRRTFESGRTRSLSWREKQIDGLIRMVRENQDAITSALHDDVGKPGLEAFAAEVSHSVGAMRYLRKHLRKWAKPERVRTALMALPGKSAIHREPLGVVLVIAPWNYPLELTVSPLAGALAAGNTVAVKPSEVAPAISKLLAELIPQYVDPDAVRVIEGGVAETTELLEQRFDHIFYTGNGTVGRIIMQAAAKHLTPVTLELGGKSPTIIDQDIDLAVTARRIAWAKFYNCGQTCVAPDYALVHARVYDAFVRELRAAIHQFWGDDPQRTRDYGRIVNARHHQRIAKLIEGHNVLCGGQLDEKDRYIAPTLLGDVDPDAAVMQEEIFGPVLPLLRVESVDDAMRFINARPKPLALYLYSNDKRTQKKVIRGTSSGGLVVNHGFLHLAVPSLPFGGVGESGMGAYHGKHSFETFSHRKSVLVKPFAMDADLLYPPYTEQKERWIRRLM